MGKKKQKSKAQPKGNAFASLDEDENEGEFGGAPFDESAGLEEGSAAWLEEQKRLLQQYQSLAGSRSQTGSSFSNKDCVQDANSSEVIDRQRRLLEQAASGCSSEVRTAVVDKVHTVGVSNGEVFSVRRICFCGRDVPILLQNRNGPCALLAVANGLLLRGTLQLAGHESSLSSADLVARLGHLCEALNGKSIQADANVRNSIQGLVQRLPKLLDGLDVNCRFNGCSEFEYTEDLALFDYFGLQLFHVWVEPSVAEVAPSWNALAEKLAICAEVRDTLQSEARLPTPKEDDQLAEAIWLEEWLEETRSQATPLGFQRLMAEMKDHEVCVLFRNNHFTTSYKPNPNVLCALLTDVSFESTASAVWESLELDGSSGTILDSQFADSNCASSVLSGAHGELMRTVQEMGFSHEQAEAGLAAVDWRSATEAVEVLLEADGELPAPAKHQAFPLLGRSSVVGFSAQHVCPACEKAFKSFNGLLNHRAAKAH